MEENNIINPFNIDVEALSHQNALVNLVLSNKDQVEFDLQMALAAYASDACRRYIFDDRQLFPVGSVCMNPRPAAFRELESFFDMFNNVDSKVDVIAKILYGRREYKDQQAMQHILYFILFSHKVTLTEISSKFSYSIEGKTKVFEVPQSKKLPNSSILFHGTHEANLYSIFRYGISAMGSKGVWMTSNIFTALRFARSRHKLILCFEAQTSPYYDRRGNSTIFEMPLHLIQLRAVIWTHSEYANNMPPMAKEVANHLNGLTS